MQSMLGKRPCFLLGRLATEGTVHPPRVGLRWEAKTSAVATVAGRDQLSCGITITTITAKVSSCNSSSACFQCSRWVQCSTWPRCTHQEVLSCSFRAFLKYIGARIPCPALPQHCIFLPCLPEVEALLGLLACQFSIVLSVHVT